MTWGICDLNEIFSKSIGENCGIDLNDRDGHQKSSI